MDFVKLVIPGDPKGKGRPRYSRKSGCVYTPSDTKGYESLVELLYRQKYGNRMFPKGVALDLRIKAYIQIPSSDRLEIKAKKLSGEIRPTKKPDWDNIGKIVADALNKVAYYDDAQIVDSQIRKFYSDNPRVEILILIAGGKKQ